MAHKFAVVLIICIQPLAGEEAFFRKRGVNHGARMSLGEYKAVATSLRGCRGSTLRTPLYKTAMMSAAESMLPMWPLFPRYTIRQQCALTLVASS